FPARPPAAAAQPLVSLREASESRGDTRLGDRHGPAGIFYAPGQHRALFQKPLGSREVGLRTVQRRLRLRDRRFEGRAVFTAARQAGLQTAELLTGPHAIAYGRQSAGRVAPIGGGRPQCLAAGGPAHRRRPPPRSWAPALAS